jgi:hypothetical protein
VTARILTCTTAEYMADPCETPSLSASIAKRIIHQSPLHAWQYHPRLGGTRSNATAEQDTGTLLHALLLNQPMEGFAIAPFSDFRKNIAKEWRDAAESMGKIVVKEDEFAEAKRLADSIRHQCSERGIEFSGESEVKVEWTESTSDGPVLCRGMMDRLLPKRILDLKSCARADLQSCAQAVVRYGYDIQGAAYRSASKALLGVSRPFVLVFFEKEPPYAVTPVTLNGQFENLGEVKWERACRTWARCLRENVWPGYVSEVTPIEAPPWALMDVYPAGGES